MVNDLIMKTKKSKAVSEGSHEWLTERVMAVFSLPLVIWLVWTLTRLGSCGCYGNIVEFLEKPINATLIIMLLGFFFTYLYLALKVVYEDYVSCSCAKWVLILGTKFISIFAFALGAISVLKILFNVQ